jgi:hypothetical protein
MRTGSCLAKPLLASLMLLSVCATTAHAEDLKGFRHKTAYFGNDPAIPVKWRLFPSAEDMGSIYPRRALADNVTGSVELVCDWDATGRIVGCETIFDEPWGYGFAKALTDWVVANSMVEFKDTAQEPQAGEGLIIQAKFR